MMEKLKMMLVDDEERFLSTTKKLLEKKGYDVHNLIQRRRGVGKIAFA